MGIPLRVLLVEDSEDDAFLLLRELQRGGYEVTFERVDTPTAMKAAMGVGGASLREASPTPIAEQTWDIVICDYSMPTFSAPAALKQVKESGLDLPFIIVSGTIGEDTAVAAMKAGAHDYIIKGKLARLIPAVARELREAQIRRERKQAEEQIKASLQEKEVLLKEIHHRVKNNLQIISSLLNLQAEYLKDNQAIEVFKDSQNRIESMALIHEKLYQSQDLARINFADYIRDLVTNLFYSYNVNSSAITLKMNVEEVFLVIDAAIPCGLIINELISNSLKYAFPQREPGEIYIEFCSIEENLFTLTISDNGVGFAPDFDFQATETLGLRLVKGLTHQIQGNIDFSSHNGVKYKIIFPNIVL
ncbi:MULTISPECIES: sensor histidine kinase [unclassified Nostoc]|uniref:sensor histidine kinase n=1 Tax=unclassified Nostoc TaxID=2593658 RepID=UPI002AD3570D|nr:histidine kinase dimerization/phosphoacceptor domain -containing protein [Nostoc sp. DedQUE03]MDZ7977033.1 histidine kinase dimerization/phosphoacceptor domain -containing protein [Nostoc sp. DedQUE03]MDZ8045100.1 histidine kinase dimerization/phosphoacceptor domain -containing protein [Nostoc sp. DedQUE02]